MKRWYVYFYDNSLPERVIQSVIVDAETPFEAELVFHRKYDNCSVRSIDEVK